MIYVESRFAPSAVSHAGACGLTQVLPRYSKYTCEDLKNPKTSIYEGTYALNKWITKRKKKKYKEALACYNAGNNCLNSKNGRYYANTVVRLASKLKDISTSIDEHGQQRLRYKLLPNNDALYFCGQSCYAYKNNRSLICLN